MNDNLKGVLDRHGSVLAVLIVLFIGALAFWWSIIFVVNQNSVMVDPIARVSLRTDEAAEKYKDFSEPVSHISLAASQDAPPPLRGWADEVKNVCAADPPPFGKETILLTKQNGGYLAVKTELTPKVCESFKRQSNAANSVFAVSDFKVTEDSKPAYVFVTRDHPDWLYRRQ